MTTSGIRGTDEEPFVLHVPPGRYWVAPRGNQVPAGGYMLGHAFELEVPPAGLAVTHEVELGGRLAIAVRAADGACPEGTFALRDATGLDVTSGTEALDDEGETRTGGAGVLQPFRYIELAALLLPGDYTLTVDATGHRRVVQTVTIRAGVTATATVRLP